MAIETKGPKRLRYGADMPGYRASSTPASRIPPRSGRTPPRAVTWTRAPQRVLDDAHPPFYRWFPDGELNTCANALDRHIERAAATRPR